MSSFGCKRPLQNAIVTDDKWFSCAQEMVVFLSDRFSNDKYYYFEIDQKEVAKKRKEKRKEHFLKGSTRMHMITVKDHIFHTRDILCTRDDALLTLRFDQANEDSGSDDDDDDDDGDGDDDDDGHEMNNEVDSDEKQNKEAIIDEVEVVNDGRIDHDCLFFYDLPQHVCCIKVSTILHRVIFCTEDENEGRRKRNDN